MKLEPIGIDGQDENCPTNPEDWSLDECKPQTSSVLYQWKVEKSGDRCLVCGESVVHRHFGERTCNSCAAFFRRSVSQKRSYFCRQNNACNVDETRHKGRCAYCRFHRCIKIGMDLKQVVENVDKFLSEGDGTLLGTLKLWHRGSFIARRKYYLEMYSLKKYDNLWDQHGKNEDFIRAATVEGCVMREFMRQVGIVQPEQYATEYECNLSKELMYVWILIELIFNTRAHGGQRTRRMYYVNDSYMSCNEDRITQFYSSNSAIHSPDLLARTAIPFLQTVLNGADIAHRLAIDDVEKIALLLICLFNKANRVGLSVPCSREWMDEIFRNLKTYYEQSYGDVATRFGQIALCVETIETAHQFQMQQMRIVMLDYKSSNSFGYDCYASDFFHKYASL